MLLSSNAIQIHSLISFTENDVERLESKHSYPILHEFYLRIKERESVVIRQTEFLKRKIERHSKR